MYPKGSEEPLKGLVLCDHGLCLLCFPRRCHGQGNASNVTSFYELCLALWGFKLKSIQMPLKFSQMHLSFHKCSISDTSSQRSEIALGALQGIWPWACRGLDPRDHTQAAHTSPTSICACAVPRPEGKSPCIVISASSTRQNGYLSITKQFVKTTGKGPVGTHLTQSLHQPHCVGLEK